MAMTSGAGPGPLPSLLLPHSTKKIDHGEQSAKRPTWSWKRKSSAGPVGGCRTYIARVQAILHRSKAPIVNQPSRIHQSQMRITCQILAPIRQRRPRNRLVEVLSAILVLEVRVVAAATWEARKVDRLVREMGVPMTLE